MSFSDFTFPQVQQQLGLNVNEADIFSHVPVDEIRPSLREQLELGGAIALSVNTEKARSEFLIAPLLLELRRWAGERLGLFSGVTLDGDAAQGLSGTCDFLLTISGRQLVVSSPIITVVEAKNDNLLSGLGQCIASMVAARMVNERESQPGRMVFGAVTTEIPAARTRESYDRSA